MARLVSDVLVQVREILQDTTGLRYTNASLVRFINDAVVEARSIRPDLFVGAYNESLPTVHANALGTSTPVYCASTTSLNTALGTFTPVVYANGTSGVGATITPPAFESMPLLDGISAALNSRVLIKNQESPSQNGVYTLTQTSPFILTRDTEFDTIAELAGGLVEVANGGSLAGKFFYCNNDGTSPIGTATISWIEVAGTMVPLPDQFFSALVYYVAGRAELRDDEFAVDGRAMTLAGALKSKLIQGV